MENNLSISTLSFVSYSNILCLVNMSMASKMCNKQINGYSTRI